MNNKNKILRTLLADPTLRNLVSRYEPSRPEHNSLERRLQAYQRQLGSDRFVLPIAGIQGCGKSTLLNAIAFDAPVLPIDADETTCVPVEIGWAANPAPQATVHYTDGRSTVLPCSEEALRSLVHNENNPGNEKGVARVVLESNREIFRNGLVLVDLPGVGSLTSENAATTKHYLEEAVGVIFMLRTVPPLTRSEATFVGLHWAALRTAIFVQNRWYDETDEEAQAGCEHNAKVLQGIADLAKIGLKAQPVIHVVNGYEALRAALTNDNQLAALSGLNALRHELEKLGSEWSTRVSQEIEKAVDSELIQLADVIQRRLVAARLDQNELSGRIAADTAHFSERMGDLQTHAKQMLRDAEDFRQSVRQRLRIWSNDKGAELRNRMRTKMRAGIVDGPRLARALADEQAITTDDIYIDIQQEAMAVQDRLRMQLGDLDEWKNSTPNLQFTVNREESTKWENLGRPVGSAGGALAGAAYGFSLGGPIGAVIGGLLGGLAGNWLGNKSKELVNDQRMKSVEGEVNKAIDDYLRETSKALNGVADMFCQRLGKLLDEWRLSKMDAFEFEQQKNMELMNSSEAEKSRIVDLLTADLAELTCLHRKLNEDRP